MVGATVKWPLTFRPVVAPDPLVVVVCAVFAVMGTVSLFFGATPGSISALLPETFRFTWVLMIVAGSLVTLIGNYWRNPVSGMFTTQVGLLATGFALGFYGAASIYLTHQLGFTTALSGASLVVIAGGFLWERQRLMALIRKLPTS